ncbi:MAG: hypothetical protein SYNGOMJ08_00281 [Candidatus Syntrophoarchaeum sp. GoM_oil]|nr:MAG: hypothetical protein SYNGOMJ08_00281 [Candidatus Syntrophoarchaeum sp. GoM_oil]
MKEKFVIGAVVLLLLSIIFAGTMVSVADVPMPNKFYGDVTLNGNPAVIGTVIEARINDELRGSNEIVVDGNYGGDFNYLEVNGNASDNGSTIVFYVGGIETDETAVWHSMAEPKKLDLIAVGESPEEICGDVTGNGAVDMDDVYMLLDYVRNPTGDPIDGGDVNCDHTINMGDLILLLNHVNNPGKYYLTCCEL